MRPPHHAVFRVRLTSVEFSKNSSRGDVVFRARAGWIAAVLLIALAVLGGPDLLTDRSHPREAAAPAAPERYHRAGEELDTPDSAIEHLTLTRRRVPGLPPTSQ